jgi:hypothetical protein
MAIRIVISGWAAVFEGDRQITYPVALRKLDGLLYDDVYFTDFLGQLVGIDVEDSLSAALERSGTLLFKYVKGSRLLRLITEYRAKRSLSLEELEALVTYTVGQWSDGIGEGFYQCDSPKRCGYSVVCLAEDEAGEVHYPMVEVIQD